MNRRAFAAENGAEGESLVRWFLVLRGLEMDSTGGGSVMLTKPQLTEGDKAEIVSSRPFPPFIKSSHFPTKETRCIGRV
jgi:hypothetical protein